MELTLQASFIELLPPINGGAVVSMALTIEKEYSYEALYWLHPNGNTQITIEDTFLKLFGAADMTSLPEAVYQAVAHELQAVLPDKTDIFAQYTYADTGTPTENIDWANAWTGAGNQRGEYSSGQTDHGHYLAGTRSPQDLHRPHPCRFRRKHKQPQSAW